MADKLAFTLAGNTVVENAQQGSQGALAPQNKCQRLSIIKYANIWPSARRVSWRPFFGVFYCDKHQNLAQIIANKRSEQIEDRDPKSISAEIYAGEP